MADLNGSPPDQDGDRSYITIAIGLITAGAILTSVTLAAYAALALQKMNNFESGFGQIGVLAAVFSVAAYVGTAFLGLKALTGATAPLRSREISRAIFAFFGQSSTAGALAMAVMVAPLFTGICLNPGPAQSPVTRNASYHDSLNDAHRVHTRAIEQLEHGNVREAAGLAWLATVKATDAVLATYTEYAPAGIAFRTNSLNSLAQEDPRVESLALRYGEQVYRLHDACFYSGFCGPEIETLVRETERYINDAAVLGLARMTPE